MMTMSYLMYQNYTLSGQPRSHSPILFYICIFSLILYDYAVQNYAFIDYTVHIARPLTKRYMK
jgi:hypothetical protein